MPTETKVFLKSLPKGWRKQAEKLDPIAVAAIGNKEPGVYPRFCDIADAPVALVVTQNGVYYRLAS